MASSNHYSPAGLDRKWTPPQRFANYILEREIDGGGMGIIYKGYTTDERKPVAIKFLIENSQHRRFQREIDTGKRIQHPNFVRYHKTGEIEGHFYIVMDFIDGLPLKRYMEQVNLSSDRRLELFYKIVSAMAYAHQCGIIHRDLKPANIMITRQGDPIILDFGLAKYLKMPDDDITALTMEGQIIGTPGYMSPEQARGEIENQDQRTDIFALGIILYEMLTARNPFEGANFLEVCYNIAHRAPADIQEVLPGIPSQLAYICNKALARQKDDRYQTAQEFADDMRTYLNWRQKAKEYPTVMYQDLPGSSHPAPAQAPATPEPSTPNVAVNIANAPEPDVRHKKGSSQRLPVPESAESAEKGKKITCLRCGAINSITADNCQNCKYPLRPTEGHAKASIGTNTPDPNMLPKPMPILALRRPKPPPAINKASITPPRMITLESKKKSRMISIVSFWLIGTFLMPVVLFPAFQAGPFIWDILAGGLASFGLLYRRGGLIGGLCFAMAASLAGLGRWLTFGLPENFYYSPILWVGLSLAFLLGMNLGFISLLLRSENQEN